jgi:hypothetical protein
MAESITPSEASDIKNGKLFDYCSDNNIEGKNLILVLLSCYLKLKNAKKNFIFIFKFL